MTFEEELVAVQKYSVEVLLYGPRRARTRLLEKLAYIDDVKEEMRRVDVEESFEHDPEHHEVGGEG